MNELEVVPFEAHRNDYARFVIPSLVGVILFLFPVWQGEAVTIPMGMLADALRNGAGSYLGLGTTVIFLSSAILTTAFTLAPRRFTDQRPWLEKLFVTTPVWFSLRLCGGLFAVLTYLEVGPEWIIDPDTGRTAYLDLAGIIFCILGPAAILMPFLTDFGFLEFVGTFMRRFFQSTFNLPGRATIDTLASWVGASSVGVLVTIRQYESGYYSNREAAVIATNFSVVSIPFVVVTAKVAGIPDLFLPLYGAMVAIGIVCAVITPRIPPLSRLTDGYYEPVGRQIREDVEGGTSSFRWALTQGLIRARKAPGIRRVLNGGVASAADLFFTMMPAAMTIEFLCLAAYHHTPFFQILTTPLVPLLTVLQIPEASAAAPGIIIGLLDQFVPALIAGSIDNRTTSFVLAGLSVTQLIFFAETAVLILRSPMPLGVVPLLAIFLERTAIALPLLALLAPWIV